MAGETQEQIQVGAVVGTHGLRGDLKVRPQTRGSESLHAASCVSLRRAGAAFGRWRVVRVTPHKGVWLLRLEGLNDLNAVEGLVGCDVLMDRSELPALGADEVYWFEIEGARVVDVRLGELGRVEEIFTTAAHDIYVVRGVHGEVLIPAVDAFIVELDAGAGLLRVDLPDGLVAVAATGRESA